MKKDEAIKRAGSVTKLAALLGITPGAVSLWDGELPKAREWQLRLLKPEWFPAPKKRGEKAGV